MATIVSPNSRRAFFVRRRITMRQVTVEAVGDIPARELGRFSLAVRGLRTLGAVLEWLRAQEPSRLVRDIVTQDEYTHDVIVPWSERLVLVFDAT
ncbi:MAG TPA: hypothetical protein VFD67_13040 [Gemmatimonadaceae bacterium]|nr:hypothetical protein [Gemmatimonadaceae bacterium]